MAFTREFDLAMVRMYTTPPTGNRRITLEGSRMLHENSFGGAAATECGKLAHILKHGNGSL